MKLINMWRHFKSGSNEARDMIVCALVVGVGSILVTTIDLVWLVCDTIFEARPYHYFIGTGLGLGLIVMLVSFIWLFNAFKRRAIKHRTHTRKLHTKPHDLVPHFCGVNPKRVVVKPDYSRYEGLD